MKITSEGGQKKRFLVKKAGEEKRIDYDNIHLRSFPPDLTLESSEPLLEVTVTKLLGIKLQSNLRWEHNTEYICSKAGSRVWTLRRMKELGLDQNIILDVYCKEIRSILELAVPAWHSGLTSKLSRDIEKYRRFAFL